MFGTGGTGSRPKRKRKSGSGAKPKYDWEKARQLYDQGWNDGQISREIGCTPHTVCGWRQKEGLPANTVVGGRRKYDKRSHYDAVV